MTMLVFPWQLDLYEKDILFKEDDIDILTIMYQID